MVPNRYHHSEILDCGISERQCFELLLRAATESVVDVTFRWWWRWKVFLKETQYKEALNLKINLL